MAFELVFGLIFIAIVFLLIERTLRLNKMKKKLNEAQEKLLSKKNAMDEFSLNLQKKMAENASRSRRDSLTNLLNKNTFDEIFIDLLSQSRKFNKSFGFLMLNIDNFTQINKEYSHEFGDKLLIEIAERVKKTIRQVDSVSRSGGDVFLFLLPNLSQPETAAYVAQRLLDDIVRPFTIDGQDIKITACIGIAVFPHDGSGMPELLKNADIALKKAKASGRNVFQFYQEETQRLGKRELSIKSIVQSDQFIESLAIDYKPYINTLTNEALYVQAIPFINKLDLKDVPYADLLRITQNSGKTDLLYDWLIKKAAIDFEEMTKGYTSPKKIIFSFTLKQLEDIDLINRILALIDSIKFDPNKIIFEITDDVESYQSKTFKPAFICINQKNIQIMIGILVLGHFAMQKITHLPITYLKLDNNLIRDIHIHTESRRILEKLLLLANTLQINVITEGVNREEQKVLLENLGCYVMQGDFFKKSSEEGIKL